MSQFPNQIIPEILTRLPAKSLCLFKSVSKPWLSLICNPQFIASYTSSHSSSSSSSWAILDRVIRVNPDPNEVTLNNLTDLSEQSQLSVSSLSVSPNLADPVDPTCKNYPAVISSSNGLLLFAAIKGKRDPHKEHEKDPTYFSLRTTESTLFVCNPITRQWVELPKPRRPINHRGALGFITNFDSSNGVLGSYQIVEYQPIIGSNKATLLTFSSEVGKWEEKKGNYMLGMHFWRSEGGFEFNGHLVWIDLSCGMIVWDEPFSKKKDDDDDHQCRFISLPGGCRRPFNTRDLERERCIGKGGGFIQFVEVSEGRLDLWRLMDYERGEWSLVYRVSLADDIWADESFLACGLEKIMPSPKFIHPFEADVVFFTIGESIFSVDVEAKKVKSCGIYSGLNGKMFVVPFVLPSWPTSIPPFSSCSTKVGELAAKGEDVAEMGMMSLVSLKDNGSDSGVAMPSGDEERDEGKEDDDQKGG